MKKIRTLLVFIFILCTFFSCSDDDNVLDLGSNIEGYYYGDLSASVSSVNIPLQSNVSLYIESKGLSLVSVSLYESINTSLLGELLSILPESIVLNVSCENILVIRKDGKYTLAGTGSTIINDEDYNVVVNGRINESFASLDITCKKGTTIIPLEFNGELYYDE